MTKNLELWWGDHSVRMGWWLRNGQNVVANVHGPSICVTSGGGPERAFEAASTLLREGERIVGIAFPSHEDIDGNPCSKCFDEASRLALIGTLNRT